MTTDENMTLRDRNGTSLVLERHDDQTVAVWIAPPGENDGYSFLVDTKSQDSVIEFLRGGAAA